MFQGSMVALVTPMHEDGSIDYPALQRLVEWHVASGTSAIVSVGTTGESATLDFAEHCETIQRTIEYAAGRIPVIAGTGANSTREAIHLTQAAQDIGADACLLVTPYYNKPTQEGLYLHYRTIAEAVDIPQLLYNVPSRTAVDLAPDTVIRLTEIPNIVGIKEAVGDRQRIRELTTRLDGIPFCILSGDDASALDLLLSGGHGVISVTANVAPEAMSALCNATQIGDVETAQSINQRLDGLHNDLFLESNPIPVKWALFSMGRIGPGIRLPLTLLSKSHRASVREALHQAGVLSDFSS